MATIYIDDKPYVVKDGQNLLAACLSLGFDVPYFCWHPAMHSVGACRICAVKQFKDQTDKRGRIVMSCMTPAAEGIRISINDEEAKRFRRSVIEWLMTNHPHDCPVCDEGGECHLQDMTEMTGHVYRRYRFKKRTYRNQDLGPFVAHEMNRCIQCYRCVRFYRDYAGGRDLGVMSWHNHVYFGRHEDGVLESEFSGNLVEVCPTGVFTDKTQAKHYVRPWDLQTAPSVCVHCSIGCNTIPGERYGKLRRIRNRYNKQVNGYFLCDRGRYGYEFVNSDKRIRHPRARGQHVAADAIVQTVAALLQQPERAIGIGSARASLEANFALSTLVGQDRFFCAQPAQSHRAAQKALEIFSQGGVKPASLEDMRQADAALVLGEDVSNTAPMIALALRQTALRGPAQQAAARLQTYTWNDAAIRNAVGAKLGPVFIAGIDCMHIDDIARRVIRCVPDDIARLGMAVAHALNGALPPINGLSEEATTFVHETAAALIAASVPVIVTGTSLADTAIIEAAAHIARALDAMGKDCKISVALEQCNSMGLAMAGARDFDAAIDVVRGGNIDTVIILETDIFRAGLERAKQLLTTVKNIIVLDCVETQTTAAAHYVLPAASFAESDGTLVNNEGRAQRYFKVFLPREDVCPSWKWLRDIMRSCTRDRAKTWHTFDDIARDMAQSMEQFSDIGQAAPDANFRVAGQKIGRQSHRYSGRTAIYANIAVHEAKTPPDNDSPLAFTMEGYEAQPPAALVARAWKPGWNSVQSVNKFLSEIGGELCCGPAGKQLFKTAAQVRMYSAEIPEAFALKTGELLVVPQWQVFGSEQLSSISKALRQRMTRAAVTINTHDAAAMGIMDGDTIILTLCGTGYELPAKLSETFVRGLALVPVGFDAVVWDGVPCRGVIRKGSS